jgi:hypothetical protein
MIHPDYQYTPFPVTAMASMGAYDVGDVVLGSRILGGWAFYGGSTSEQPPSSSFFMSALQHLRSTNHKGSKQEYCDESSEDSLIPVSVK